MLLWEKKKNAVAPAAKYLIWTFATRCNRAATLLQSLQPAFVGTWRLQGTYVMFSGRNSDTTLTNKKWLIYVSNVCAQCIGALIEQHVDGALRVHSFKPGAFHYNIDNIDWHLNAVSLKELQSITVVISVTPEEYRTILNTFLHLCGFQWVNANFNISPQIGWNNSHMLNRELNKYILWQDFKHS